MSNDTKIIDQVQPQAPVAPISPANKEMAPIGIPEIGAAGIEAKPAISQESAELGVKEVQDRPDLTQVVNMHHAGPSVPVQTIPTGLVQIPQTTDINSSGTWLNVLLEKGQKLGKLLGA